MWRWRGWRGSKERDEVLLQLIQISEGSIEEAKVLGKILNKGSL